jgi:hypothetical protein
LRLGKGEEGPIRQSQGIMVKGHDGREPEGCQPFRHRIHVGLADQVAGDIDFAQAQRDSGLGRGHDKQVASG